MTDDSLFHLVGLPPSGAAPTRSPIAPAAGAEFVHLCRRDQLEAVRRRHFGAFDRLAAFEIDPAALDPDRLRDEDLYGHGAFPHYYATIPRDAIIGIELWQAPFDAL